MQVFACLVLNAPKGMMYSGQTDIHLDYKGLILLNCIRMAYCEINFSTFHIYSFGFVCVIGTSMWRTIFIWTTDLVKSLLCVIIIPNASSDC